jgi:peptide/nickel transport system ATP-binding protein
MADRILVLRDGAQREVGATAQIITQPQDDYTRSLIAAANPKARTGDAPPEGAAPLLEVRQLVAGYGPLDKHGKPAAPVLDDISLKLHRGQAIGVIGESGSGKTTLARVVAGLVGPAGGQVLFDGKPLARLVESRSREELRRIQIVFQMADTALNPSHAISDILARPLQLYRGLKGDALDRRIAQLLDLVHLPQSCGRRLPGGLSGGQKQRGNLARALAAEPDQILCDEVTSALDTVVGAAILDLLAQLRKELGVSYMFISHDLNTVRAVCDEIVVLYAGQKVEEMGRSAFGHAARHPYFHLLATSVPELRPGWLDQVGSARRAALPLVAAPADRSGLCSFLDRCPLRVAGQCDSRTPPRRALEGGVEVFCHRSGAELLALQKAGEPQVVAA